MDVTEFILRKMAEKEKTKKAVYEAISMGRQTFENRLESGKFYIDEFLDIAKFLDIDPAELWGEWKIKEDSSDPILESSKSRKKHTKYPDPTLQELIRQNGELIGVINKLSDRLPIT